MQDKKLTAKEGVEEINNALWQRDSDGCLNMYVQDDKGMMVHAWLMMRPQYCDRGHIQFCVDGIFTDWADSFPRYFFNFEEADTHVRTYLKWRLWKHREHEHEITTDPRIKERE